MRSVAIMSSSNNLSANGELNDTTSSATRLFEDENFWESDSSSDSEGLFLRFSH